MKSLISKRYWKSVFGVPLLACVDGAVDGTASYGATRPDIPAVFPHAPASVGFSYPLDTTKYPNAAHTLNVRVTDSSGNVAVFADVPVTVCN
jgi:hypothetical protein